MNKKLSEPVTLIAIGLVIALLARLTRDDAGTQVAGFGYAGFALIGIGGAWWLAKGHIANWQAKRARRASVGN